MSKLWKNIESGINDYIFDKIPLKLFIFSES